jgi:hypothetical protein
VSDAAPARRWPTLLMVAVVITVAVYQAITAQYERAARMREMAEIKALIEWVAVRCDSR